MISAQFLYLNLLKLLHIIANQLSQTNISKLGHVVLDGSKRVKNKTGMSKTLYLLEPLILRSLQEDV